MRPQSDRMRCPKCQTPTSPYRRDRGPQATDARYACRRCAHAWSRWWPRRKERVPTH